MILEFLPLAIKVIIICFSIIGLYYSIGLNKKKFKKVSFIYFTNLNLVFCIIYFVFSIFVYNNKLLNDINGFIILSATVTMIVYQFVLVPKYQKIGNSYKVFSPTNIVVHYVIPLLVILNWFIFTEKSQFSYYSPFLWIIPFLIYFSLIMLHAHYSCLKEFKKVRYPYYFMDLDKIGVKKTLKNLLIFSSIAIALGYLLVFLDFFLK
ncbi:MAG: Pr6Pr family membrane protein [Methanobrevibacter sp.]|nr:Pr6Pr family membrane protein [Methanobrevibacter sp.]